MKRRDLKIAVVGAGSVGATIAQRIVESDIADVVIVDIQKDIACGKAFDLADAAPILGHERSIIGTDDYSQIAGSQIVVVTAGLTRKSGTTRDDLLAKNAATVTSVSARIKEHAPGAIVIVVTNPLDAMTYLAWKTTGFDRKRVLGMAGVLDGSRFAQLVAAELKVPRSIVETFIMGSHGDTMVPILSRTTVGEASITDVLPKEKIDAIIQRTRDRGTEIITLLGTSSSYYSPSAGVLKIVEAIVDDTRETLTVTVGLEGEYGLSGITIGVPCMIGKGGIDAIVQFELSEEERKALALSAASIKRTVDLL